MLKGSDPVLLGTAALEWFGPLYEVIVSPCASENLDLKMLWQGREENLWGRQDVQTTKETRGAQEGEAQALRSGGLPEVPGG